MSKLREEEYCLMVLVFAVGFEVGDIVGEESNSGDDSNHVFDGVNIPCVNKFIYFCRGGRKKLLNSI